MIVPVDQRKAGNALVVWKWNVEKLRVITMEMNTGLRGQPRIAYLDWHSLSPSCLTDQCVLKFAGRITRARCQRSAVIHRYDPLAMSLTGTCAAHKAVGDRTI